MANATIKQEYPAADLTNSIENSVEESFDVEHLASLIARPSASVRHGCNRATARLDALNPPANLRSHKAYVTGFEILSAFGMSFD